MVQEEGRELKEQNSERGAAREKEEENGPETQIE
jgi:hypothetical protein